MISRSPSNQRNYDLVWSRDEAFVQLPDAPPDSASQEDKDAYEKLQKAHIAKWEIARESGDYSALRVEGKPDPTVFTMKPLSHEQLMVLWDMGRADAGVGETNALAFAAALQGVTNLGDAVVERNHFHPKLGMIASTAFFEKVGVPASVAFNIELELGQVIIARAATLSKK